MHPVTAQGYNLGLYGVEVLAETLRAARAAGRDIGAREVLAGYEARHRRSTLPIFLGTQWVVRLFTDERGPGKLLRGAVIAGARHLPPLRVAITRQLTGRRSAAPGAGRARRRAPCGSVAQASRAGRSRRPVRGPASGCGLGVRPT